MLKSKDIKIYWMRTSSLPSVISSSRGNVSVLKNDIIYVEEETYDDIELMARLYKASGILPLSFPRQ